MRGHGKEEKRLRAQLIREGKKTVLVVGNAEDLRHVLRELQVLPIQEPLVKTDPPVVDYGFLLDAKDRRM